MHELSPFHCRAVCSSLCGVARSAGTTRSETCVGCRLQDVCVGRSRAVSTFTQPGHIIWVTILQQRIHCVIAIVFCRVLYMSKCDIRICIHIGSSASRGGLVLIQDMNINEQTTPFQPADDVIIVCSSCGLRSAINCFQYRSFSKLFVWKGCVFMLSVICISHTIRWPPPWFRWQRVFIEML